MSYVTWDNWNNCIVYVEPLFGETPLSNGTGFFWKSGDSTFLVTNWHVLSGRHAIAGTALHSSLALPDRVAFFVPKQGGPPDAQGAFRIDFSKVICPLVKDPDGQEPIWFEHPAGRKIDVGVMDVTALLRDTLAKSVNEVEDDAELPLTVSQDLFILGFPFGLMPEAAGVPVPLWKRGTIALDPSFDPGGLPKLLVDMATREGMSGSVAIARHLVVGKAYKQRTTGSLTNDIPLYAILHTVEGIYSGRHNNDLERAQLGIVWKRRTIEEVINGRRPANIGLVG